MKNFLQREKKAGRTFHGSGGGEERFFSSNINKTIKSNIRFLKVEKDGKNKTLINR